MRDRATHVCSLAASVAFVEIVLTFGTGRVPVEHAFWIAGVSAFIGLAGWLLAAVADQFLPVVWGSRLLLMVPVVLFSLRGGDGPVGAENAPDFLKGGLLLVAFVLIGRVLPPDASFRRFAVLQVVFCGASAIAFLLRTVDLSTLERLHLGPGPPVTTGALLACAPLLVARLGASSGHRRILTSLVLLLLAGVHATWFRHRTWLSTPAPGFASGNARMPDVIVIVLDTARWDAFSTFGGSAATPSMDELAATSTTFSRAYTTGTYSLPAHASLFSGLLPSQHGAHDVKNADLPIHPGTPLLADELRARGYTTMGISANSFFLEPWTGLQSGFATFWSDVRHDFLFWPTSIPLRLRLQVVDPGAFMRPFIPAADLLRRAESVYRGLGQPLFLFLNLMDVHEPLPTVDRSNSAERQTYDRAIEIQDKALRRFLASVRSSPRWSSTLLVVTSDHGQFFGEHGSRLHRVVPLMEPVLRIPLFVRFPGQTVPRKVDSVTTLADIKAFILSAVNGHAPEMPGTEPRIVAESWWDSRSRSASDVMAERAIYWNHLKLIQRRFGPNDLFDLVLDPGEEKNLLATRDSESEARMDRMLEHLPPMPAVTAPRRAPPQLSQEQLDRLRAIGYVR